VVPLETQLATVDAAFRITVYCSSGRVSAGAVYALFVFTNATKSAEMISMPLRKRDKTSAVIQISTKQNLFLGSQLVFTQRFAKLRIGSPTEPECNSINTSGLEQSRNSAYRLAYRKNTASADNGCHPTAFRVRRNSTCLGQTSKAYCSRCHDIKQNV
jgi:hypothetical protein